MKKEIYNKKFFGLPLILYQAIAILSGTIIGAGVLGIPYVISRSGFLVGLIDILILGITVLIIHLYLGEVILRTKENHQLMGYAECYLKKPGKLAMGSAMIIGLFGALVAYTIGIGNAMKALFGGNQLFYSLCFFLALMALIYLGLNAIKNSEIIIASCVILIIIIIFVFSFNNIDIENFKYFDFSKIFFPYGVILFAFMGSSAIPEMRECLINNKKYLKKSIIIGSLIPLVLYILFTIAVLGVTGTQTTEVATVGLGKFLGMKMLILGNLFAVFAMSTSFLALGFALKGMFMYDYKLKTDISFLLTFSIALLGFILLRNFASFKDVISYTGIFAGGIESIVIILMFNKAKKLGNRKPEYSLKKHKLLSYLLILIFILGIIFSI